jgi:uncharacterized protein (TIGR03435 family)
MRKPSNAIGIPKKLSRSLAGLLAVANLIVFGLMGATPGVAQLQVQATAAAPPKYEFEAASIKPVVDCSGDFLPGFTVDGYRGECVSVRQMIREAYGVKDYGLLGGPGSLNTQLYDVEAKMDASVVDALAKLTPDQLKLARQQMLQALLAERLNLKVHRETKEEPVYFLSVGKSGPKLRDAEAGDTHTFPGADGSAVRGQIQLGSGSGGGRKTGAHSVSMSLFGEYLSFVLARPVVDRTGLTGVYDFTLEWMPDVAQAPAPGAVGADNLPGIPGASIFTAIQEQLGLKLESGKSPVEIIVIDHVERPSGN